MFAADPRATYVDENGPFAPLQARLSTNAIMAAWINAGGDPNVADEAAAIALAESSGYPNAVNPADTGGQTAWGLFQLSDGTHSAPGKNWADPTQNAAGAVTKYNRAGGTWAQDWGTYGGSAYHGYLEEIRSGKDPDPYSAVSDESGDNVIEKGINSVTGGAYDKAKHALDAGKNILLIPEHILDNLGPFTVGILLLLIGGLMMSLSWGEHLVDAVENVVGGNVKRLTGGGGKAAAGEGEGAAGEGAGEAAAAVAV